jgi:hypothetical protein
MTADWGNSHPFMFDMRQNETTWLVCVECTQYQFDATAMDVALARSLAEDHIPVCPALQ